MEAIAYLIDNESDQKTNNNFDFRKGYFLSNAFIRKMHSHIFF